MDKKHCNRCKTTKFLTEFNKDKTKKDGHRTQCRECEAERHKLWRENNKEKITEINKLYYENNKEKKQR